MTVSLYRNLSVWLVMRDSSSCDQIPSNFTLARYYNLTDTSNSKMKKKI